MLRLLHYLPIILVIALIGTAIFLVYRYATRDTRTAPKRRLLKQLADTRLELHEADQMMENLVDTAKLWKDTEPNMADTVIYNISEHKSARAKRDKELYK